MGAMCGGNGKGRNNDKSTDPNKNFTEESGKDNTVQAENCPKEDKGNYERPEVDSDNDSEEGDDVPDLDANMKASKKDSNVQRISVSAEVYGLNNQRGSYVPKVVAKTEDIKSAIRGRLNEAFMFSNLEDKEKDIVINAMEECPFAKGDVVINQGDDGAVQYQVFSGALKCERFLNKNDEKATYLKTYVPGEAFGEQALLYNAPRAATIIADEDSVCYSLDRDCFNHIVKESTQMRRERFEEFVSKINLLQELETYERSKITDCLTTAKYHDGEVVIEQGDVGNKFYFIEHGNAQATKSGEVVYEYKENDYFGELALLQDEPRAASIVAIGDLTVAWIDRFAFKRLLGPLEGVLKRNASKYEEFVKN